MPPAISQAEERCQSYGSGYHLKGAFAGDQFVFIDSAYIAKVKKD
jgi:hypothetical protein